MRNSLAVLALGALTFAAMASGASAASLIATYYDVTSGPYDVVGPAGPDFDICCSTGDGATLPAITLGAGLMGGDPVTTTTYSGPGTGVFDQSSSGQILWWTPSLTTGVTYTGSGAFAANVNQNMYAPNSTGANDASLFETAVISGTLTGSGHPATLTVSSDDDALVYVNGLFVGGNPGVHGTETTVIDLGSFTGSESLEVFYADRAQVGADLDISLAGVSVPEPAAWTMMLVGLGSLGALLRGRRRVTQVEA